MAHVTWGSQILSISHFSYRFANSDYKTIFKTISMKEL